MYPTDSNQLTDNMTLNCERCQHVWFRRNPYKLPNACPNCKSSFWQSPLTQYWKAYHKAKATTTQSRPTKQNIANQMIKLLLAGQLNQADNLILYTCPNQAALEPIRAKCNFWLPEQLTPEPNMIILYCPGNTIATTKERFIRTLRDIVRKKQLPHHNVFWINIVNNQQDIYMFTKDGNIQTCYQTSWPAATKELS